MPTRGFVDLQVNGWLGVDFSDPDLSEEKILITVQRLNERGTAGFCPTVTTSAPTTYEKVLPLLARASHLPQAKGKLLGIHLEGPFINPADGAAGVHPVAHIASPSVEAFRKLYDLCEGTLKILTLAPEMPGAEEVTREARCRGVAVSIGHTLCDSADVKRVVDAGATLSTHLGNGCPGLLNRHHNPLWAQLDSPLTAMLIADGHHLPPAMLRIFLKLKGIEGVVATSDAAPVAGLPCGEYRAFGHRIRITPTGRIENCEQPTLAGSSAVMLDCMNHLATLGVSEAELWRLGFFNPLAAIGLQAEDVAPLETGTMEWNGSAFSRIMI